MQRERSWEEHGLTPPLPQPLTDVIRLVGLWDTNGTLGEQRRVSVRGQRWKDVVQDRNQRGARFVPTQPPDRRSRYLPISRVVIRASPLACLTLRGTDEGNLGFGELVVV